MNKYRVVIDAIPEWTKEVNASSEKMAQMKAENIWEQENLPERASVELLNEGGENERE